MKKFVCLVCGYVYEGESAPEECPICKEGKLPLVHLGSRKMKQEAKQTL